MSACLQAITSPWLSIILLTSLQPSPASLAKP